MVMNDSTESIQSSIESSRVGQVRLNRMSRVASVGNREIALTSAEFEVLDYLANRPGEVVTRNEMYQRILGKEYDGLDRTIDLRVSRLRRKLNGCGEQTHLIKSIRSEGYILTADSNDK